MLPRSSWFLTCVAVASGGLHSGAAYRAQTELDALRLRDARVTFTAESARRARAVLEAAPAVGREQMEERAVALLALGCGGAGGDLARIEARLESGTPAERSAALFALGELELTGWAALARALERETTGLEEPLCVALALAVRDGALAARERLQALAAGDDELARRASQALAWGAGEDAQGLGETLALYYELRWSAGRSFGLVDGLRGAEARKAELFANDEFLERVVLGAAGALPAGALESHLQEILRSGERPGALRLAALVLPEELERAFQAGEWEPSAASWETVLAAIDQQRSERRTKKLLGLAYRSSPELEPSAGRLLFRAGEDIPWSWVVVQLEQGDAEQRALLIDACGDRGEKERIPDLEELIERRAELGLSGAARVALVRLAHAPARKELEALLEGPPTPQREQALAAVARVLYDRSLWRHGQQALKREDLRPEQRLDLLAGLAENGALVERAELRAALPRMGAGAQRRACVRALAHEPESADLEALAALFPLADDLELDVELALVLLSERHPATGGLLASALWRADWNCSVLAGGLIVASAGPRGLLDELDVAPSSAGERDLRRVGFALGEWGGLGAVEPLARTRSEGDPVLQGALLGALASRAYGGEIASPRPRVELEFPSAPSGGAGTGGAKPKPKGKGKKGRSRLGG